MGKVGSSGDDQLDGKTVAASSRTSLFVERRAVRGCVIEV
jgi:hypothetical protein